MDAHGQANGADKRVTSAAEKYGTSTRTTAYYIAEGVNGCFKDRVLCGVNFEPCPVSLAGGRRRHRQRLVGAAVETDAVESQQDGGRREGEGHSETASAAAADGAESGECGAEEGEVDEEVEDEDAVVMGPSGLPADVVARKRLPKSLKPGDWLYFSQMGAYTASIATVTSSAVLEASYFYVASTPGSGASVASRGGIGPG